MKTTVEKLSPTRVKLNISVTPDELKPSIAHAYEHIAQSVNIPGFRKGKVPPQLIDQRVGREEVLNHAVSADLFSATINRSLATSANHTVSRDGPSGLTRLRTVKYFRFSVTR